MDRGGGFRSNISGKDQKQKWLGIFKLLSGVVWWHQYHWRSCVLPVQVFLQLHELQDQALSLWSGSTDSKTLDYQRTNPQFSSVTQSCSTLCDPMNRSTPGLPVHHQLLEFTQTHVHRVGNDIQPSHPLLSPSPPAPNPSQHQGLFQWVNPSHEVAKVLEFQLQHQSFQWTPRTDLLQNGLVGSPCSPRDSQESSPTPQFKNINSSVLSFLHSPTLTSIHDHWKNHSLD